MASSRLVFGTGGRFGRLSPSRAQYLIDTAIELGITSFDTGLFYCNGQSQIRLFSALRKHLEHSRSSFEISTKFPPNSSLDVMNSWLNSTVDPWPHMHYIDTLFVWGPSLKDVYSSELVSSLRLLLASGKVNSIGVNTHSAEVMTALPDSPLGSICECVMIDFNLLQQDRIPLLGAFASAGIKVWAGTALCQGFLFQSLPRMFIRTRSLSYLARAFFNKPTNLLLGRASKVRPLLKSKYPDHYKSIPLSYVLSHDHVAKVPIGMLSRQSMVENIGISVSPVHPDILDGASKLCQLF